MPSAFEKWQRNQRTKDCFGKQYDGTESECRYCPRRTECKSAFTINQAAPRRTSSSPPSRPVRVKSQGESHMGIADLWKSSAPNFGEVAGGSFTAGICGMLGYGKSYLEDHPFNFSRKLRCGHCGTVHSRRQKFCGECGQELQ